jgi:hypothetical protein
VGCTVVVHVHVAYRVAGLCAVAVGAVFAVDGPAKVEALARDLIRHAGLGLIAVAVIVLVYNLAPRSALAGPILLAIVGVLVLAWQNHWWTVRSGWSAAGTAIALLGGYLAMRRTPSKATTDPAQRLTAVLLNRRILCRPDEPAPERLNTIAILSRIDVDLSSTQRPAYGPIEMFVTCWGAAVYLKLPRHWALVAGRLAAAKSIRFSGALDWPEPFPNPDQPDAAERLEAIAAERAMVTGRPHESAAVVVHVLGIAGHVSISRSG